MKITSLENYEAFPLFWDMEIMGKYLLISSIICISWRSCSYIADKFISAICLGISGEKSEMNSQSGERQSKQLNITCFSMIYARNNGYAEMSLVPVIIMDGCEWIQVEIINPILGF